MVLEKDVREGKGTELVLEHVYFLSSSNFSVLPFSTLECHLRKIKMVLEKDGREGKGH
jgi:hypothetical protein